MTSIDPNLTCSFCTKRATEVRKLIAGPSVYICDECIDLCYGLLHEIKDGSDSTSHEHDEDGEVETIPTPTQIKDFLDQYVIGQENAKRTVAVAVYKHYKRLFNPVIEDVEIEKSNILMLGPTGSGKTLIAQTIARLLDVPFAIADATSLTEAGYVGDDVESVLTRLLQSADQDVKKAERGIIYIDEIDKKARRGESSSGGRDVSGEGVQQALLKMLEGSEVFVPTSGGRKGPNAEIVKLNTKNILFIVGGAFVGIDKIVEKTQKANSASIGFGAEVGEKKDTNDLLLAVEPDHLTKFGLIPELVGRLPVITSLVELSTEDMIHVLTEPKNALTKQFQMLFKLDDVELEFTEDALIAIANKAKERKTGARGLRGILEKVLEETEFMLPDLHEQGVTKVVINQDVIDGKSKPEYVQ
jgi:ATP-dependent Clp protease ATP-binding subunit ClpX